MYFDFKLVWLNVDQFEQHLFSSYLVDDFRSDYDPHSTPPNIVRVYVDLTYSRIALVTPVIINESNMKFFQKVSHVLQQMQAVNKPLKQYRLRLGNLLQVQTPEQVQSQQISENNYAMVLKNPTLILKQIDFTTNLFTNRIIVGYFVARRVLVVHRI